MDPTKCDNAKCSAKPQKLSACTGCRLVAFCSKACQVAAWSAHKSVCQGTSDLLGPMTMETVAGKGRGFVATRDIVPGTLLLRCSAFACVFDDEVQPTGSLEERQMIRELLAKMGVDKIVATNMDLLVNVLRKVRSRARSRCRCRLS